jgi:hypothetical protein
MIDAIETRLGTPNPPAGAPQSSNPNLATPELSSESGASVSEYTTGHCSAARQPGGCPHHNLQCGWPECDRRPVERVLSSPRQEGEGPIAWMDSHGEVIAADVLGAYRQKHGEGPASCYHIPLYTNPSTAASTQGLREYITRIKEAHKHAATYSLTEYEKGWTRRGKVIADELESLLTSPTTGADGGGE